MQFCTCAVSITAGLANHLLIILFNFLKNFITMSNLMQFESISAMDGDESRRIWSGDISRFCCE